MVNQVRRDLTLAIMILCLAELITSNERFHPLRQTKVNDPIDPTGGESPGIVIVYKKSSGGGDRDRDRENHQSHHSSSSRYDEDRDRDRHHHSHPPPPPPPPQSPHGSHSGFGAAARPPPSSHATQCANSGGFYCSYDREDYPMDKIKSVSEQYRPKLTNLYEELNHYPLDQYISHDNSTHSYRHKGHFICESEVSYVRPGWAKNWRGEWVTVLNTDVFPQSVRIETCKYANKRCDYVTACYKSYCVQRYTYVKLICVDPYNADKKPSVDVFEIPSACSCFVENFSLYK